MALYLVMFYSISFIVCEMEWLLIEDYMIYHTKNICNYFDT